MSTRQGGHRFRARGPGFAVALLVSIIAAGTIGYMLLEGRGAWDAFYTTVLELTTVESPGHLTRGGQAFTVVLLLGGIGAALYTFTLLATVVVEGGLPKRLRQRRHERMLETISDHFIICGYGRIGSIIAQQFRRQQVPLRRRRARPRAGAGGD